MIPLDFTQAIIYFFLVVHVVEFDDLVAIVIEDVLFGKVV